MYKWKLTWTDHKRQLINLNSTFSWPCFVSFPFKSNYVNDSHKLNAHLEICQWFLLPIFLVKCCRIGPRVGRFWWQRDKITELTFHFSTPYSSGFMVRELTSLPPKLSYMMCRKRSLLTILIIQWVHMGPQLEKTTVGNSKKHSTSYTVFKQLGRCLCRTGGPF